MTHSPGSLKHILYYGTDELPPVRTALRAGPLSRGWENGDLRYISLGQHEVCVASMWRCVIVTGALCRTTCRS